MSSGQVPEHAGVFMRRSLPIIALSLTALAAPTQAQVTESHFYGGVTGGTLGVGPELGFRLNDHVGVRGNATFLGISHGFDSGGLHYDGKAHLKSGGLMLDVFPFGGGFRISAGARLNGNDGRARATPNGSVTVGRTTYTPAMIGTIDGTADTRNVAPALTLGWAGHNRHGFVFGAEAGALFQGRIRINRFTNSTGLISAADLETQRQNLQNDANDYKVYPILQLTVGYRF